MKKLILASFLVFLAFLVAGCPTSKAAGTNWSEWQGTDIDSLAYRTCDFDTGSGMRHMIQFKNVQGTTVHVTHVTCNGNGTEGAVDLGPAEQLKSFSVDDNNPLGVWLWSAEDDQ